MMFRRVGGAFCVLGLTAALAWAGPAHSATEYVEGEALVIFKEAASFESATKSLAAHGLTMARHFAGLSEWRHQQTALVRTTTRTTTALIAELQRDPLVEVVEPNYLRWATGAPPNDPMFGQLWGLQNTGQTLNGTAGISGDDIKFLGAWSLARPAAAAVVVAVIDTGVGYTHP